MKKTIILMSMAFSLIGCEVDVPQKTIDDITSDIVTREDIERIIEEEVSVRVEEMEYLLQECINKETK